MGRLRSSSFSARQDARSPPGWSCPRWRLEAPQLMTCYRSDVSRLSTLPCAAPMQCGWPVRRLMRSRRRLARPARARPDWYGRRSSGAGLWERSRFEHSRHASFTDPHATKQRATEVALGARSAPRLSGMTTSARPAARPAVGPCSGSGGCWIAGGGKARPAADHVRQPEGPPPRGRTAPPQALLASAPLLPSGEAGSDHCHSISGRNSHAWQPSHQ